MTPGNRYVPPSPDESQEKTGSPGWLKFFIIIVVAGAIVGVAIKVEEGKERRERQKQVTEEVKKAQQEVNDAVRNQKAGKGGSAVEAGLKSMGKVKSALDRGAAMGGDEGKEMKATSALVSALQPKLQAYNDHTRLMKEEKVFDISYVKTREDIARRRKIGMDLARINADLASYTTNGDAIVREFFAKEGITGGRADAAVRDFKMGINKAGAEKAREADAMVAQTLVEMYDLLDAEWGKWSNGESGPIFQTQSVLEKYGQIRTRMKRAIEGPTQAQREVSKP